MALSERKQMLVLSATYPADLATTLATYMRDAVHVRIDAENPSLEGVFLRAFFVFPSVCACSTFALPSSLFVCRRVCACLYACVCEGIRMLMCVSIVCVHNSSNVRACECGLRLVCRALLRSRYAVFKHTGTLA